MVVTNAETKKQKVKLVDPLASKHGGGNKIDIPYDEVCKKRYHASVVRYNQQFLSELNALERMQPTAYEQMRFHRIFAITTLWPPLHTRKEIDRTIKMIEKPNPKVARRVEEILNKNFK